MSRFSKAEAEAAGWRFVHTQKEEHHRYGQNVRVIPGLVRAEKNHGEHMVTDEAETIGKLLEKIHEHEQRWAVPAPPAPEPVENEGVGLIPDIPPGKVESGWQFHEDDDQGEA